MDDASPVYIGIDPTAGRRPLNYAVLDGRLRILAQGIGSLDAVLDAVAGYPRAVVAVDAPQSLNGGLLAQPEVRRQFGLRPYTTTWAQFKVCEYLLRRRGIGIYNTPADPGAAKSWMRLGWQLYDRLRALGFQPLRPGPEAGAARTYIEVYPYACFTILLGHFPYKKNTLEGRLQRQLLLDDCGVRLPDAMDVFEEITRHRLLAGKLDLQGLLTHDELDALVSAYTAYVAAARPGEAAWIGDEAEGQIVLPAAALKERYGPPGGEQRAREAAQENH